MFFAVLIFAVVWLLTDGEIVSDVANGIIDVVERGERLTVSTVDRSGIVLDDASDLVERASLVMGREISIEAYALARMIRSEDGSAAEITKVRLINVAQNQADRLGWSILRLMQYHTQSERDGRFGRQISGRFATTQDPYRGDVIVAEWALSHDDQTDGATNFAHISGFGVQEGTGSFADFVDTMASEGKRGGTFPESGTDLVFFWRGEISPKAEPLNVAYTG